MSASDAAEKAAMRIDQLLADLRAGPDPRAAEAAEELTRCLVGLYGDGLARIIAMIGTERGTELCADPLVESLLLVHDLHPLAMDTRVREAIERAWPRAGELAYLGCDAAGVIRLRLTPGGSGCASSRQAALHQLEEAVRRAAPEAAGVEVDTAPPPPPLLQISVRPGSGVP